MRAVIDTNIWISAVLSEAGFCAPVVEALRRQEFSAVVSPQLLWELGRVGTRRRLIERYGLRPASVARIIDLLRRSKDRIEDPENVERISRDPRDDIFIAVAAASKADCLVSRDDDLKRDPNVLAYLEPLGVRVMSVRDFRAALEDRDPPA